MTFDEIIRGFARSETVPEEAIKAALDAPGTFVDMAIPLLERIAATKSSDDEDDSLSVLVHVLAEIGDERAFPPLMRVLALPPGEIDELLGDSTTESLGNVVISLMGDNAPALEAALADTGIEEYVRNSLFDAWTYRALTGTMSREHAKAFLTEYPSRVGLDSSDFGWSSWADSVTALGFSEMQDYARRHLPSGAAITSIMDTPNVSIRDFERQLSKTLADPQCWKAERKYRPFGNTISELSDWYGYSEAYREERKRLAAMADESEMRSIFDAPFIANNPYKDVGRNDPCPCGSGKKFKKCCLA